MEGEEKRWRQIEQALRRLIGRLCAAGMGVDPQLDDELIALAAANRRNADAQELEKLAASLTTTVMAVDAVSPVPTIVISPAPILAARAAVRWDSACKAAEKILQRLLAINAGDPAVRALISALSRSGSDADLAAILEKTADLVQGYGETLAEERVQAAAMLAEVTRRLEEVSGYLADSGADARSRFEDSASVNDSVMSQVRELSEEVSSATELRVLQTLVNTRLETVRNQVLSFRSREESRQIEHTDRAERMGARIADLERETEDLHFKLDREKHGARLDPLTRLGNRKSFDERLAHELSRLSTDESSLIMLLWDLDNFKFINDTYGHRAGDRVLQSVATYFMSGLRAEDFVARIGGEEFVMLMTGLAAARAQEVADELRAGVEGLRFHFRGAPVRVTVSCGFTELRPGDAPGEAFDRADAALYRAKNGGKNVCVEA